MWLLGQRGPRNGLILLYHRVAQPRRDPQLLAVTPERFEAHLAMLLRRTNIMQLSEMLDRAVAGKPLPRRSVAITFDDGYVDNVRVAEPMLAAAKIPATLFVATGYVETGRPYWWDAIDTAILGSPLPSRLELPFPTGPRDWSITDEPIIHDTWNVLSGSAPGSRRAAYVEIMPAVKPLDPSARERVLNALRRACGVDLAGEPDARPMTPQDVAEVDRRGIIEVGAHTVDHPQLSRLDPVQQDDEIAKSARTVAQWTGNAPALFAYPYGSNADYDADSVKAVKRAGFRAACSNFPGLVNATTSAFELPRMLVRNVSAEELESLIDGAFAAEVAKR
jgi:peptidoglycan/xylan/chitin deacetylase (PgdA/CDA1 family)